MGLVLATLMLPGQRHAHPAVRPDEHARPGEHLPGADPAVPRRAVRRVPDPPVLPGLPDELLEAARIDGASEFRIFWPIAMPLATPVLATLGILDLPRHVERFIYPLVMAQEPEMYTLPVALATFATGQYQADHGMLMAARWSSSCPS